MPYLPANQPAISWQVRARLQTDFREMASHLQCLLYRCHSHFSPSSPQHIDDHDLHQAQDFTIHSLTASAGVCAMHDSVLRNVHVRGAVPPRSPRNHLLLAQALSWLLKPIPDSFLHILGAPSCSHRRPERAASSTIHAHDRCTGLADAMLELLDAGSHSPSWIAAWPPPERWQTERPELR